MNALPEDLHVLFDLADDLYWTVDNRLRLLFFNNGYRQLQQAISGKIPKEGEDVLADGFAAANPEKWKGYYSRALQGEQLCIEEQFAHAENGEQRYHVVTLMPVIGKGGKAERLVCSAKEITQFIKTRSEAEQVHSEQEYLFNSSLDIICTIDQEGRFVNVSAASEKIWGYRASELCGKAFIDFVFEEDRAKTISAANAIMAGVDMTNFENRYIHKDGRVVPVLWSATWDQSHQMLYCVARDATEMKKTEEHLKTNEDRFKALIQDGGDLIAVLDAAGTYKYVSPTSYNILGIAPEEFLGKNAFDFIHADDKDRVIAAFGSLSTEKRLAIPAFRFHNKEGEWRWVETIVTNMTDHPAIGGIVANSRDVTDRIEHEQALRLSEDSYRTLFQSSPLPKWIYDLENFTILDVNETAIFHYGYSREEFLGMTIMDLRPDEEKTRILGLQHLLEDNSGVIEFGQMLHKRRDGSIIKMEVKAHRLRYQERECMLVVCNDVTEKEHYLQELHASEQRLRVATSIAKLGYWTLYFSTNELIWSDEVYTIWGRDRASFPVNFEQFISTIHEDDRAAFLEAQKPALSGQRPLNFIHRIVLPDGTIKWVSENGRLTKDTAGQNIVLEGTVQDITDQIRLQKLVDDATNLANVGSWEIDLMHQVITWTKKTHDIHETDPNQFVPDAENGINFYHPDYREEIKEKIALCISSGKPFDMEAKIITRNGNERWVRVIGEAEFLHGNCVRVYGSFQDVHDRKIAELRLQNMADNIPGVIFQYHRLPDGSDRLLQLSKGSLNLWGITAEAGMANNSLIWDQIEAGGDFELVKESMRKSAELLEQWHCQFRNRLPNGKILWLEGFGTPQRMPDGGTMWDSLIIDITELKETEALLHNANEMSRIGSWELNLENRENDAMYWSPMTRAILEVGEEYNPSLTGGFEFYEEPGKTQIKEAVDKLIQSGTSFDLELKIITQKGNSRWIRCIGRGEFLAERCVRIFGSYQDIHAAKTAEQQLREVLGSISDAFYAVDKEWKFTYFNKEAERLLEMKEAEVIGKNIWEVLQAAIGTEMEQVYKRVAATGKSESFEYLFPGDNKWYELNVYASNGGVASYFKNIDERKKSAAALQKAYEEKTNIVESIGDAFFTMDRNFIVSYWNKAAENLIGVKREQLIGKNLWDIFPEAVSLPSYSNYHKVMETGEAIVFEDYYGVWLEVNAYPTDEGISVFFRDITLRKEADLRLRTAYEEKNQIVESISDAFFTVDKNWTVTYWNKQAELFLGMRRDEILGKQLWNKYDDALNLAFYKHYQHAAATGETVHFEEYYPATKSWFEVTAYPSEKGLSVIFRDVTYRKQYEERLLALNEELTQKIKELEIANDELEQFAFIASHDLQEPLRMISSFLNQLERRYSGQLDEKAHQYIYFATDGAKRMKRIILELLDYSRAGKLNAEKERVDLQELFDDFVSLRRKLIKGKKAVLDAGNLPVIDAYQTPLKQVIHCLLDNALKYAKNGKPPKISFQIEERETDWLFRVQDNGIGIKEEYFEKIFIIFQRLHNKDEYGGTGMGLAIVKKHVDSWGGSVWLTSEPGEGSCFYFTVPKIKS